MPGLWATLWSSPPLPAVTVQRPGSRPRCLEQVVYVLSDTHSKCIEDKKAGKGEGRGFTAIE